MYDQKNIYTVSYNLYEYANFNYYLIICNNKT